MRTLRPSAVAFAVVTLTLQLGVVASAHHSRAGYDTAKDKLTTLNGVVTEVIWRNPHVFLIWDSKDEKGTVVKWTGEFSSPATKEWGMPSRRRSSCAGSGCAAGRGPGRGSSRAPRGCRPAARPRAGSPGWWWPWPGPSR